MNNTNNDDNINSNTNDNTNNNTNNNTINNENINTRTFYFNQNQSNENIIQQITNFVNNITNVNQINENDLENEIYLNHQETVQETNSEQNQNIQMLFEIEFLMEPENNENEEEIPHFNNCNHINRILGKAHYIKKDDVILKNDCNICMEEYKYKQYKRILPICNHTFHKKCIDNWLKKNSSCPVCRKDFLNISENLNNL
jgi:hypothetical protein